MNKPLHGFLIGNRGVICVPPNCFKAPQCNYQNVREVSLAWMHPKTNIEIWFGIDISTGEKLTLKKFRKDDDHHMRHLVRELSLLLDGSFWNNEQKGRCLGIQCTAPEHHIIAFRGAFAPEGEDCLVLVLEGIEIGNMEMVVQKKGTLPAPFFSLLAQQLIISISALHSQGFSHNGIGLDTFYMLKNGRVVFGDCGHVIREDPLKPDNTQHRFKEDVKKVKQVLLSFGWGLIASSDDQGTAYEASTTESPLISFLHAISRSEELQELLISHPFILSYSNMSWSCLANWAGLNSKSAADKYARMLESKETCPNVPQNRHYVSTVLTHQYRVLTEAERTALLKAFRIYGSRQQVGDDEDEEDADKIDANGLRKLLTSLGEECQLSYAQTLIQNIHKRYGDASEEKDTAPSDVVSFKLFLRWWLSCSYFNKFSM